MNAPDISVVMAASRDAEALPVWLGHLEQQTYPAAAFEILVVDATGRGEAAGVIHRCLDGAPVRIRCIPNAPADRAGALNRGLEEAHGKWVLFTDSDVLAGPRLIERHLGAHRAHAAPSCIAGGIALHPQLPEGALTRWYLPEDRQQLTPEETPGLLDCSIANLSVLREDALEAGGFSSDFPGGAFAEADLVWRMESRGSVRRALPDALVYAWRPAPFNLERSRQYARGYALHQLAKRTGIAGLGDRFHPRSRAFSFRFDGLVMPFYIEICRQGKGEEILMPNVYRRILRYAFFQGHRDARKGRPPAP